MVSLDTNSSVTQSLVGQLVSSATVNGAFSISAFESELSSVISQVLSLAASSAAQTVAATGSQTASGSTSGSTGAATAPPTTTGTSTAAADTPASAGSSQNSVATQSQQPAGTSQPVLAMLSMFGGTLPPVPPPMVVQSGNLLVNNLGVISAAPAGTPSVANSAQPSVQTSAPGSYTAGTMIHSYDPFSGSLCGPLVPASGTTWTQSNTGKELDSGAVIAGLESRYGAGTATMITVLNNQFGVPALDQYQAQNPSTSPLYFASLPPLTAFQFYGPEDSFVDPNNGNQVCYFDVNGVEHLSGAGSIGQA